MIIIEVKKISLQYLKGFGRKTTRAPRWKRRQKGLPGTNTDNTQTLETEMTVRDKFFDYGKHDLIGYQQAGDIHGKYYGSWFSRHHNETSISISLGNNEQYWLQIGNCYHSAHATPEKAAKKARELLCVSKESQRKCYYCGQESCDCDTL